MPAFFIERPVFAWVIALFILLAGALSIPRLPVAQYPAVAPPSVSIYASYPGASAQLIDDSVTSLIEEELNGADGLLYFESQSDVSGFAQVSAIFAPGTDPQRAQIEVQNRLKKVEARLPQSIKQQGLFIESSNSSFLLLVTLSSTDARFDEVALGDYLARNVVNEIRRLPGVGRVAAYAPERAMRIWIDPARLLSFDLTMADVASAIAAQNAQIATGRIGDLPNTPTQRIVATVTARGQLNTPEEFGAIVLRAKSDGASVRLRDVATVEIGAQSFQYATRLDGKPTAAFAVQLAPDGNALATAEAIREKMHGLARFFPEGIAYAIPYDTSPFVKISIRQVVQTLLEAVVLVFLVVYVFLQNLRFTLIPTIVVPIALAGSFAVMLALGYSINVLTLFGMILAIGILVDDAIVVVENVERIMAEEGLSPREATRKAMGQITGAIIGITLALVAVFIPMAFMSGSVGGIYRQFAVAMASSILFSAFLALSLTPALCATLLRPAAAGGSGHGARRGPLAAFNRLFERSAALYSRGVAHVLRRMLRYGLIYLALIGMLGGLYALLPTAFLPVEDQGYLNVGVQLPADATLSRTEAAVERMERHFSGRAAVQNIVTLLGTGFSGNGQNTALAFVTLRDWSERDPSQSAEAEAERANVALASIKDGIAYSLVMPPIDGLGNSSGFALRLQDRAGLGRAALLAARDRLLALAAHSPVLSDVRSEALEDGPQLQLHIDRERAAALGVAFTAISDTLVTALGSSYVNDFPNGGHLQQVIVQAEAAARMQPEDLLRLHVRSDTGSMVPLSAFTDVAWQQGPLQLTRYNGYPALPIAGDAAPGHSSGAAMAEMERLLAQLPPGFGYEWSAQSLQERISAMQAPALLGLSILVVFLVLAALYESWSIPFAALLAVPLGMLGAVLAVTLRGMPDDVFFKVGLITIIGLSAKNAILIIEYARDAQARGDSAVAAVSAAARLRFRPIVMTSLAFIFGVLPLAFADGAGAPSQRAIGTGVLGGMIGATVLALFWVPLFFVLVRRLFGGATGTQAATAAAEE